MNVREVGGKAGVPPPPALRVLAFQIGDIFHGAAETGRADHRAIGARQASPGYVIPARVLVIAVEQFFDAGRFHSPAHLSGSIGEDAFSRLAFLFPCRAMRKLSQYPETGLGPGFNHEVVAPGFEDLRQSHVKPGSRPGPSVHGHTEARPARLTAIDRNDKDSVAPGFIGRVNIVTGCEN